MSFNDMVAQLAHVAWGALLVYVLGRRISIRKSLGIVSAFAIGKEVIESVWGAWEPRQAWHLGFEDMAFWFIGIGIGYWLWKKKL